VTVTYKSTMSLVAGNVRQRIHGKWLREGHMVNGERERITGVRRQNPTGVQGQPYLFPV